MANEEIKKEKTTEPKTQKKSAPKSEKKTTKPAESKKKEVKKEPPKDNKPKMQRGLVANCARLNVRSLGVMTSGVVAILNRGESVLIDPEKSTDGWYAVKTKNGKPGFCMKKYIVIP